MIYRIYLRPEAEAEISETAVWYAQRSTGLGTAFLDEVSKTLAVLEENPDQYPVAEGEIRKAVLRRFPYVVLFRARGGMQNSVSGVH